MSLEKIIETLVSLGLSRLDAEVYVCIAKNGPKSVNDLDDSLNYSKIQISKSLKNLITITLVNKQDPLFSALPFEQALELLIVKKKRTRKNPQRNKKTSCQNMEKLTPQLGGCTCTHLEFINRFY